MKKLLLGSVLLMALVSISQAKTYECFRYVGGSPTGTWIKVQASSKSEAESKAYNRFKELGGRVDGANCHYTSG